MGQMVKNEDIIYVYDEDELIMELTGKDMRKMIPTWSGTLSIGDTLIGIGREMSIKELQIDYPGPAEAATKYKVYIEEYAK
ncbi:hypothetical protein [Paenibacillus abyssi]|uniref:Uncharacterized protein n=1 Tax=Paenibacillus abyssi TaxID=1340531 RepID=A0A917CT66_9BACL|nr:hypothetical protein [Paenibacillus abyssi]GGF97618.1 hypothetical protein GCM10010916_13580 [Paenibacillus abyssi]